MAFKYKILSIDGGGIFGLIAAKVLAELETRLEKTSGTTLPLCDRFDLIAGTSIGGIIAAGLAAPQNHTMTAVQIADMFEVEGGNIFSRSFYRRFREFFSGPTSLLQERYDSDPIETILSTRLGDSRVSQARCDLLITAYDIEARKPRFFYKGGRPQPDDIKDAHLWQAGRATSAAPTYFEPEMVVDLGIPDPITTYPLIDGGVFANNPTLNALCRAGGIAEEVSLSDVLVVSVGCGYQNRPYHFNQVKDWGALNWINPTLGSPIISILMQGHAYNTHEQLACVLKPGGNYFRFDGELLLAKDEMDDASPGNIANIKNDANRIIKDSDALLNTLTTILCS